jgi:hypothetical protein
VSPTAHTPRAANLRKSTIGRPRLLTDAQVVAILDWHDAMSAWKAQRATIKTLRQFAKDMGVSHGAITHVIRRHGEVKRHPRANAKGRWGSDADSRDGTLTAPKRRLRAALSSFLRASVA